MIKSRILAICVLLALQISSCSVDLPQGIPAATVAAAPSSLSGTAAALPGNVPSVQASAPTAAPTQLPVTWAGLHLTGKLIYTAAVVVNSDIGFIVVNSLDLSTGIATPIFQSGNKGWIDSAVLSPDGKTLVVSYGPPIGTPRGGQVTLYSLPADGSQPEDYLFRPGDPKDQNNEVVWSPDGKYLYFAHMNYTNPGPLETWRVAYPDGAPEKLLDNGYWPRLSDDSSMLTYVTIDPDSSANHLFVAQADGTSAREVPVQGAYLSNVIDVPMFTPDGQGILFSSQDPPQSSLLKGLGSLVGIELIHPPDGYIPSDWWSIPITGGVPKQLTHLGALSLYGGYSPDRQHVVSCSTDGIFVMNPDGTGVTMIVPDIGSIPGTVQWIP